MKMSPLSLSVIAALANDRTAQLNTLAAMTVDLFIKASLNEDVTGYAAEVFKLAPHKSAKTWANYASTASGIASNKGASVLTQLLAAESGEAAGEASMVTRFATWLDGELRTRKYTTGVEDVGNWAKGRPSLKAKAKAEADAVKEQAKLDKGVKTAPSPQATTPPAPAPAPAVQAEAPAVGAPTPAYAPTADKVADTGMVLFTASTDGEKMTMSIAAKMTRAEMMEIVDYLLAECKAQQAIEKAEIESALLPA